jgi:dihydrofolate reductase
MAQLIFTAIVSLDGYVEDEGGSFDWAAPDEEVHAYINGLERPAGTHLYGRRMYETMRYWETAESDRSPSPATRDYAQLWRAAEKIVYSRTLETVSSARTRIAGEFDADAVRRLKETSTSDISIGGAELAGRAMEAGLVDELRLFLVPILVGGGKRALPSGVRTRLELIGERPFHNNTILLRYRVLNRG